MSVILRYNYDANSRLASRWSAAKGTTYYTNDAVGNLIAINYPASPYVALAYDALNRLTNMVDAAGTTRYGYTAGGRLWTEDGPWSSDTVTNIYANRLRTGLDLAQPAGQWTNRFAYDAARRLTTVTSPAGNFTYTLGAMGEASPLIKKLLLPNTSYITNAYDVNARLAGTWLKKNDNTILNSHQYVYDPANERTQQVFNVGSTYNYTYDKIGQLKVADSATASEDLGYAYDAAWNLSYRTNNTTLNAFYVDVKNQLTNSTPGGVGGYDSNGNLTSMNGGSQTFTYDDENQLATIWSNNVAGGYTVKQTLLTYDGRLRLRRRVERSNAAVGGGGGAASSALLVSPSSGGGTTNWITNSITEYVYDGMRVIQERDGNNVPTVSHTRGTDLSGSLEGAGGIGGLLARSHGYSGGAWSAHNYYHSDGNGNVTYLVTPTQVRAASYRYDPYGNLIGGSEITAYLPTPNTYRFSSKESHDPSGLYYYGYRWYLPSLQRWVNRDPVYEIGFSVVTFKVTMWRKGRMHLYEFVENNPLSRFDTLGLLGCSRSDPCANACQKVKSDGGDKGDIGGTVCCNGKKIGCVWKSGGQTGASNPKAARIIDNCVQRHEDEHAKAGGDCPPNCIKRYDSPTPPDECSAYKATLTCFKETASQCDGDPNCIQEVFREIEFVRQQLRDRSCPR